MSEWPLVTLSEVCEKPQYGAIASGTSDPKAGPLFVRQTDLWNGLIDWEGVPYCTLRLDDYEKYAIKTDDILIARLGSVGRSARVRDPRGAVFAGYLVRFRSANPEIADPTFLGYQLRSTMWWDHVEAVRSGAVQPTFNAQQMGDFKFLLPPINLQKEISRILNCLDDKIESNRLLVSKIEELGSAILESKLEIDPYGFPKFTKDRRLGDILDVLETGSRPKGGIIAGSKGIVSLGAESVQSAGVSALNNFKRIPVEFANSMKRGHLQELDILVYKDGGKPGNFIPHVSAFGQGFPTDTATINEHVYRVRSGAGVSQGLLYWLLRSSWMNQEMRKRGTGVAIPGLNSSNFRELPLPDMDSNTIESLNELFTPMLTAMLRFASQSNQLALLRDTLLPELLTGRLKIHEVSERSP